jgi:flagellum-specific ATP synthase
MPVSDLDGVKAQIASVSAVHRIGRVSQVEARMIRVRGLTQFARIGDQLELVRHDGRPLMGEVVRLEGVELLMLPDESCEGVSLDDRVSLLQPATVAPCDAWIGRIVDPQGNPLDGRPLLRGPRACALLSAPPPPAQRRSMGERLETGLAVMNTLLPLVRGQRVGLFSGSGVGKSSLLAHLAKHVTADLVVIALIGERGRELRDFVEQTLGPDGMARAIIIAATSDQSALARRRCAWTAMTVAEYFRDQGRHVLFLADSITRFAEAHREVSVAAGEAPTLRGFPPSTAHMIMSLCERAGPGQGESGDISAIFSVLVAGSDMEEPISDILRGVLDGHIVLDRAIAERGRYPAIDVLRSVSRSLPLAASADENALIGEARRLLGSYDRSEMMVRSGLYSPGSDELLDRAVSIWPELDSFVGQIHQEDIKRSFSQLALLMRRAKATKHLTRSPQQDKSTDRRSALQQG